jgi:hypothetical protein
MHHSQCAVDRAIWGEMAKAGYRKAGGRAVRTRQMIRSAVGGCASAAVAVNQVNLLVVLWLVSERHVGRGQG